MQRFWLTAGLLAGQAYAQRPVLVDNQVCYEYVKVVVTHFNAGDAPTTGSAPTASSPGTSTRASDEVIVEAPYTGTSSLTAPVTSFIPPQGTEPGTIIVQTPVTNQDEPQFTTIFTPDTGTPPLTEPSTTTIFPSGTELGTVIITTPTSSPEEPSEPDSSDSLEDPASLPAETTFAAPSAIPDEPEDIPTPEPTPDTTPESSTTTSPQDTPTPPIVPPAGETFSCDEGGYLIQQNTLYRLNLATGENPIVRDQVGPGGNINALGYNIKDDYLYAFISIGDGQQQLIRIDAAGDTVLLPLQVPSGLNVADIDDDGQFWVSSRGNRWIQVDLDPSSPTFTQEITSGRSSGTAVADWVYLRNGGRYLYSIELGAGSVAVRWSMDTHEFEELRDYGDVVPGRSGFGALYAVGDELWGSDNQSGDIIAFPVLQEGEPARKITDGPSTDSNDGARCFEAPPPEFDIIIS